MLLVRIYNIENFAIVPTDEVNLMEKNKEEINHFAKNILCN